MNKDAAIQILKVMKNINKPTTADEIFDRGTMLRYTVHQIEGHLDRMRKYGLIELEDREYLVKVNHG
ncbi:MAG: hypothetical protein GXP14_11310 [Gammaproteobacteria bacterium]|nr:hypothetical protein [Gammaproteobacteria bacterium]